MPRLKYDQGPVTVTIGQTSTVELPPRVVRVRLTGMLFETDKTFLLPSAMKGIRGLVDYYQQHPGMSVVVTGHTDRVGDPDYNRALSDERAQSIAHYLQDEIDPWLACYQGSPHSQTWSSREDQYMLSAVRDQSGEPFYNGPITGQLDGKTRASVGRFQRARNLSEDGTPGPDTRRALIQAYLQLDGTTLPAGVELALLGCGESHNEVATADGVDEPKNRRVEIFLFDPGPPDPAAPARCPGAGCAYLEWKQKTTETYDFEHDAPQPKLRLRLLDPRGAAFSRARFRLTLSGGVVHEGVAGADGWLEVLATPPDECDLEWGSDEEAELHGGQLPYRAKTYLLIDDSDDREAARRRLWNLGYTPTTGDEMSFAIGAFQEDWRLPATGELDAITQAKLIDVHDEARERS